MFLSIKWSNEAADSLYILKRSGGSVLGKTWVFKEVNASLSSEILHQIKIVPLVFDASVVAVSVALAILLVLKS